MKGQRWRGGAGHLAGIGCVAIVALVSCASTARAQTSNAASDGPFRFVMDFQAQASEGATAIAHDLAVRVEPGVDASLVHVFERTGREPDIERWEHVDVLTPSDGGAGFGRSVATDGTTIVVGATGAAYVFEQDADSGRWREVARLTGDVMNTARFGNTLSVSGTTIAIGVPLTVVDPIPIPGPPNPGIVFVFERNHGSPAVWAEAARLSLEWSCGDNCRFVRDNFGMSVSIDDDILVVGSNGEFFLAQLPSGAEAAAFIYSRQAEDRNVWVHEATIHDPGSVIDTAPSVAVSISGDTVVMGSSFRSTASARVYERNQGGPKAWGQVARLAPETGEVVFYLGGVGIVNIGVSISGDVAIVSAAPAQFSADRIVYAFARNQSGRNAWGEVARFDRTAFAISGDTALVGSTPSVYVLDTDRDGLRDGIDPCPRDPLNTTEPPCQRLASAYPALDDAISLAGVTTSTAGHAFFITGTFTNTGDTPIRNPFFEVVQLTGGNTLENADAGPGGVGATLSPDVGDGILAPGESVTVTFVIRLETRDPFGFFVTVRGEAGP